MAVAANTPDCFRAFFGKTLKGYMRLASSSGGHSRHVLVFEDGTALGINDIGSYWIERTEDIEREIRNRANALAMTGADYREVLELAGEKVA